MIIINIHWCGGSLRNGLSPHSLPEANNANRLQPMEAVGVMSSLLCIIAKTHRGVTSTVFTALFSCNFVCHRHFQKMCVQSLEDLSSCPAIDRPSHSPSLMCMQLVLQTRTAVRPRSSTIVVLDSGTKNKLQVTFNIHTIYFLHILDNSLQWREP